MRRFELVEGTSSKFWEIALDGAAYTVRYGRLGTNGQTQTKSFDGASTAVREHDRLVAEKLKKGYTETNADADADGPATATANAIAAPVIHQLLATPSAADTAGLLGEVTVPTAIGGAPGDSPSDVVIDEDRVFWDNDIYRRVWARRGVNLPIGTKVLTPEARRAQLDQPDGVPTWTRQRLETYLRSGPSDKDAAHEFIRASHASVDWIAVHAGIPFTVETLAEISGDALRVLATISPLEELRSRIAALPDAEYRAAEAIASGASHGPSAFALAFLFPTEPWATAVADALHTTYPMLTPQVSGDDTSQLSINSSDYQFYVTWQGTGSLATDLLFRFASSIAPRLSPATHTEAERVRAQLLARIGSDEAFSMLVSDIDKRDTQAAISQAARRQPHRAVRMLSAVRGKHADIARLRLGEVLNANPGITERLRSHLSAAQLAVIDPLVAPNRPEPAPDEVVPDVLRRPPWTTKRAAAQRPVLTGVRTLSVAPVIEWDETKRRQALASAHWDESSALDHLPHQISQTKKMVEAMQRGDHSVLPPWAVQQPKQFAAHLDASLRHMEEQLAKFPNGARGTAIAAVRAGEALRPTQLGLLPQELIPDALLCPPTSGSWTPDSVWLHVLAVYGLAAEPYLASAFESAPTKFVRVFTMLGSTGLAPGASRAARSKSAKGDALAWLRRFPEHAAAGLIPVAVGPLGRTRDDAELALRFLDRSGAGEVIRRVAASTGPDVAAAVDAVLGADPLAAVPTKRPAVPTWMAISLLHPVMLRDGSGALPDPAVANLLTMSAFSSLDDPYAGIELVKEACTPDSLAKFSWSVFEAWLASGYPSSAGWALTQLGLFGDDDTARRLAAMVRVWPGEGGHARATTGLEVLAAIGSDVALMHLNRIGETVKFKALRDKAKTKIQDLADARGLTKEELADRLVPDLGLDDDGSMWLDFGPRRFRVGFDELLAPFVRDEAGAKLRALPKPNAKDDPEKAGLASERWKGLKKDATDAAKLQVRRIEFAMCTRRKWSAETFQTLFVDHPLMRHVTRRLVWATYGDDGALSDTFRVAEDSSLADANDDSWALNPSELVGLPHRLELGDEVAGTWGGVLADYELLQPFPQVGRDTYVITEQERSSTELSRLEGQECHFGKILGLEYKGWGKGQVWDAGIVSGMTKPLPSGLVARLDLDEGLYLGAMTETPRQKIRSVYVTRGADDPPTAAVPLSTLDPIEFSELVRDLESIRA